MDREEKLRAAKEKLKRFQTQKKKHGSTPDIDELSQRSTPKLEEPPLMSPAGAPQPVTITSSADRSQASSSVSDQISCVLEAPSVADVADNELEVIKARLSQLDRDKMELGFTVQQQNLQIQQLQKELEQASVKLEEEELERQRVATLAKEEAMKNKSLLDSYAESIQILVSEKAELQTVLDKVKKEKEEMTADNERLLKSKQQAVKMSPRERTCACTDRVFLAEVERQRLSDTLANLRDERDRLKIETIDLRQEVLELKSKIEFGERNIIAAAQQLVETTAKLELAEVNLAQLRAANEVRKQGDEQDEDSEEESHLTQVAFHKQLKAKEEEIVRLTLDNDEHVKRVADLTAYIQQASQDREQIIQQYTSYSQQLASQIESLTQQLNINATENHSYATREADLVAHVQRLEGQLQSLMQKEQSKQDRWSPSTEKEMDLLRTKVVDLDKKVADLQQEREKLIGDQQEEGVKLREALNRCKELQDCIGDLETRLEMTSEKSALVDATKHESLIAASESDKVAASRAMKQNQSLKTQVEELEGAVMQLTSDKAELAEKLDSTHSKLKRLEEMESSNQNQIKALQEVVKERDRNLTSVREQMKYYTAFAEQSIKGPTATNGSVDATQFEKLISDLSIANDSLKGLNSENLELRSQIEAMSSLARESATPDSEQYQNGHHDSTSSSSTESKISITNETEIDANSTPSIPSQVAISKLEQKFKAAMQQVAELTSEKEHLEHLIARLQDETDTVGEYITIYQYQRAQQKARLDEKERQLQSLSRDREDLRSKVTQLQSLVKKFVTDGKSGDMSDELLGAPEMGSTEDCEIAQEADEIPSSSQDSRNGHKETAAQQILTLLSEIGSNEMLNHDGSTTDQFHPWFWEPAHGKLMTV